MNSPVRKINKRLVGIIIGGTLLGITSLKNGEKGKGIFGRALSAFVGLGRRLLDKAEHRGNALGGMKKSETTRESTTKMKQDDM